MQFAFPYLIPLPVDHSQPQDKIKHIRHSTSSQRAMANPSAKQPQQEDKLSLVYDTALCLILPSQSWPSIDRLRSLYDKAYEKWPPHVNLIYPFVRPEVLPAAAERIQAALSQPGQEWDIPVELDTADAFIRKNDNTLFRCDGDQSRCSTLNHVRNEVLKAIGHPAGNNFRMHMTIAQSEDASSASHKSLLSKVGLLPTVSWTVDKLHILVRERLHVNGKPSSQMKLWGTISLSDGSLSRLEQPKGFYGISSHLSDDEASETGEKDQLRTTPGYYLNEELDLWVPYTTSEIDEPDRGETPSTLTISSYNVLADFDWPPSEARHPLLLKTILSREAVADVLVLQEVTDTFLSAMLQDDLVRERYPYVSHGPPSQDYVEPLPSMLNIVILSQLPFDWEFVSFHRKHKGSVVAKFRDIKKSGDGPESLPTILAAVHLSHGLTDGAVAAKKIEIQMLLRYLAQAYPQNPLILAGDTNISTSFYSINAALQKKNISAATAASLASFDQIFSEAGLSDAWAISRSEMGDTSYFGYGQDGDDAQEEEAFDGEQGATYDPLRNEVAAEIVGSGFNNRPQRFDRILVRGGKLLEISRFNKFGFLKEKLLPDGAETFGSDHWGVRAVLKLTPEDVNTHSSQDTSSLVVPVHLRKAPSPLSEPSSVKECLANLGVLPTEADISRRKTALESLKKALQFDSSPNSSSAQQPSVIIVPVGSYALGVWTSASDMDILCIGPFSSTTFFALATQRLRKAHSQDIRILRRVKANTGLMLELQVHSIKMDLQYCPAGAVAQNFPQVLTLPASDPIWSLSPQTLSKLKALRDVDYLRRSISDLGSFRTAHRFIKTWAKSRGIYTARFGFLGSIHISILLTRVHKLLALNSTAGSSVSVPDLLTAFFGHYATFNWEKDLVFDPFFHKQRLGYTRSPREPLAILGYFPPSLNTAHAASVPSVRAIAAEFKRAGDLLSSSSSWTSFLTGSPTSSILNNNLGDNGAQDFLTSFKSFVKIDVQYWGLSPSRGAQFIGWLESRCVMLLVDMNRRAPGVYARMWPGRFVEPSLTTLTLTSQAQAAAGEEEKEAEGELDDCQTLYLIGLDKAQESMTREDLHLALGAIQTSLSRFETQIRGDEKYFDAKNCWMACTVVKKSEVSSLHLKVDTRDLGIGEYTPGEEEEDDGDDDGDADDSDLPSSGHEDLPLDEEDDTVSKKKKAKKGGNKKAHQENSTGEKKPKFRTAADVMNRLKWDPQIDSSEYIIGYEDRFLGARERPLAAWKTEQTDEEFIPLHRILYFKRKHTLTSAAASTNTDGVNDTGTGAGGDEGANVNVTAKIKKMDSGEIVWERKTRKDLIFGSGVE